MRHNYYVMPKQITEDEFNDVIRTVARFPEGVSIDGIAGALEAPMPRRTLQRRIAFIVSQEWLSPEGEGRGRRYRLPVTEKGTALADREQDGPASFSVRESPPPVSASPRAPLVATVGIIAAVVPYATPETRSLQWPAQILAGLEHGLSAERGLIQRFFNLARLGEEPLDPVPAVQQLLSDGVKCVVVIGCSDLDRALILCEEAGVELISLDYDRVPFPVPQVYVDTAAGGALAARHLRDRGYSHLTYLRPFSVVWVEARLSGARAVTGAEGLRIAPGKPIQDAPGLFEEQVKAGYDAGCALLTGAFEPGAGVIAPNDSVALGFMRAAKERGLQPGKHYGIVGFDDRQREAHLTSLRPPLDQMGEEGARLAVRLLRGEASATRIALQHRLIARSSTAPAGTGTVNFSGGMGIN